MLAIRLEQSDSGDCLPGNWGVLGQPRGKAVKPLDLAQPLALAWKVGPVSWSLQEVVVAVSDHFTVPLPCSAASILNMGILGYQGFPDARAARCGQEDKVAHSHCKDNQYLKLIFNLKPNSAASTQPTLEQVMTAINSNKGNKIKSQKSERQKLVQMWIIEHITVSHENYIKT